MQVDECFMKSGSFYIKKPVGGIIVSGNLVDTLTARHLAKI